MLQAVGRYKDLFDARGAAVFWLSAMLIYALVLFVLIPASAGVLGSRYGIGFADDYDRLANSLRLGYGYRFGADLAPTLMREPGYPLFLAGVFALFGYSIEAARFANFILAGAGAFLVLRLAALAGLGGGAAALAAAIFLFHPGTLIAAARGGFEIFFVFLLMLFILAFHRATQTGAVRHYLVAGVVLGVVALTRSTIIFFPAIVLAYFLLTVHTMRERARYVARFAGLLAVMLIVMAPWIARNYAVSDELIVTTSVQGVAAQAGQGICEGMSFAQGVQKLDTQAANERNNLARSLGYSFKSGYYQYFYTTRDEISFNRLLLGGVVDKYRAEPMLWLKCAAQNMFNFWFAGKTWPVTGMNMAVQVPFLIFALIGLQRLWREGQWGRIVLPVLLILYLFALHVPIHAQARYSIPLVPFLAILASAGIVNLLRGRERR